MSRQKSTSDYRKDYTPEQRDAEKQYRLRHYQQNQDALVEKSRAYVAANRDEVNARKCAARLSESPEQRQKRLAYKRANYQQNKDARLAYALEYTAKNAEVIKLKAVGSYQRRKDYLDSYRLNNAEKITARRAKWKAANIDRITAKNAEYLQNNLDKHRANQHNRRARKIENGGRLSTDIVQRLLALQRGKCACCGAPLGDSYDLDHIVPLALGGPNTDENVQLLRMRCNRQKGSKHPVDFMQARGFLL